LAFDDGAGAGGALAFEFAAEVTAGALGGVFVFVGSGEPQAMKKTASIKTQQVLNIFIRCILLSKLSFVTCHLSFVRSSTNDR
jgi:hypothetical protein